MAGYYKNQMSNNAVWAYSQGEKPMYKWTKTTILEEIDNIFWHADEKTEIDFKKMTLKELKENFLVWSSWHHTGKNYNETDFYCIEESAVLNFTVKEFDKIISNRKKKTYTRRTAAELEQIKAEKEKDILLTERSKEIYRKLYIIYIYKSDLKTFKGLINRFLNDKINIEKDFAESVEIARQKEEHRIKCWQGDVNDWHNREGIVDLYYKDISTYVLKMRGVENYQIDKKLLKQIKNKIMN